MTNDAIQWVREQLRPIQDRLRGMITRGTVKVLQGDDTEQLGLQRAQIAGTADDVSDGVECMTPFGFTSRPGSAEALVFAVGGNPSHQLALLFDRTTRLKTLDAGEAALYVGRSGQVIRLLADGGIEIKAMGEVAGTASSIVLKANGDIVITPGGTAKLLLGDEAAVKKAAAAEDVQARLDALSAAISGWVVAPMDGGAALKAALAAWLLQSNVVGSTNVYVKG